MNQYGQAAMDHWRTYLPGRYAQIDDPEGFFSDLGEQADEQIDQLADGLAGTDRPGESYLGKVGRLTVARKQAEEKILAEMILLEPERDLPAATRLELEDKLLDILGDFPDWVAADQAVFALESVQADEGGLLWDEEAELAMLRTIRALLEPFYPTKWRVVGSMSDGQITRAIDALRPYWNPGENRRKTLDEALADGTVTV